MEVDTAYANLFGTHGEAAVLACDELGLVPRDLLHRPKDSFERTRNDSSETVLVRYTLTERTRQNNIRKLLAIKNRLISEGEVAQGWKERRRLFPDAPSVPKIPRAIMEKAMAEMDTESDKTDSIDEFGLVRPVPQFSLSRDAAESRVPTAGSGVVSLLKQELEPLNAPSQVGKVGGVGPRGELCLTTTNIGTTTTPAATGRSISGLRHQRHRQQQQRYGARTLLRWTTDSDDMKKCILSRGGGQELLAQRRMPPPEAPLLPPMPYPRRSLSTLKKEVKELDEYRRFLLRYAYDSVAMAEEYNQFVHSIKSRDGEGKKEDSVGVASETRQNGNNASNAVSTRGGGKRYADIPAVSGKTSHEKQIAAYVRMAKMEVERNSSNYKKWNGFLEEMDAYEPVGTIAADLRGRTNIGICSSFEDYVHSVNEMRRRRERALAQERRAQKKLQGLNKIKERHAEQNIEKLKSDHNDLFSEARNAQWEIMKQNREREDRRYNMKQQRTQARLSKKKERAATYHKNQMLAAKDKRFEHDQEEVFRRNLKEKLNTMDMRKKWNVNSVTVR